MRVALTGASGHIGSCLVRELVKQGAQLKVLVHRTRKVLENLPLETIAGDLLDRKSLDILCNNAEIIFHLAAQISIDRKSEKQVVQTNIEGTKNLIEACKRQHVPRLIHFSSIHALDVHPLDQPMNETRSLITKTRRVYEYSKAESERLVLDAASRELDVVILTPTAVIGPYDYQHSYLGQALIRMYNNKLPVLVPGGYNWVDVRDVAQAALASVTQGRKGERYILSGHWSSLKELSGMISALSGGKTPRLVVPYLLAYLGLPSIRLTSALRGRHPLYTRNSLEILKEAHKNISNEKARKELGYDPRPLAESLADTFTWYKQQGLIA